VTPAPSVDPFDPWGLAPGEGPDLVDPRELIPGAVAQLGGILLHPAGQSVAGADHCPACALAGGMVASSTVPPGVELTDEWRSRILRVDHQAETDRVRILWGDLVTLDLPASMLEAYAGRQAPRAGRLATLRAFLGVQAAAARGASWRCQAALLGLVADLAVQLSARSAGVASWALLRRRASLSRLQKE